MVTFTEKERRRRLVEDLELASKTLRLDNAVFDRTGFALIDPERALRLRQFVAKAEAEIAAWPKEEVKL